MKLAILEYNISLMLMCAAFGSWHGCHIEVCGNIPADDLNVSLTDISKRLPTHTKVIQMDYRTGGKYVNVAQS